MPTINGTSGNDVLNGTTGNDAISGGSGDDVINGGDGNDTISDTRGSNTINGGAGDDSIDLNSMDWGGTIYAGIDRTNVINAGDGSDIVHASVQGAGTLSIDLGAGNDLLTFSYSDVTTVTTGAGSDRIALDIGSGGEAQYGFTPITITDFTAGNGGDVLDLGEALNYALQWSSSAPNPFANGYLVLVQDGSDVIVREEPLGGDFGSEYARDLFRLENVNAADLTAYNFAGYDPAGGDLQRTTVTGTNASEWLSANVGGSDIDGLDGNDLLTGDIGNDALNGGAGNDKLNGGSGNDTLNGGIGSDTLEGGLGNDVVRGDDGDDVLTDAWGTDTLDGGAGNDTITIDRLSRAGNTGAVTIFGGDGDDTVHFNSPDASGTTIDLGAGNDRLEIQGYTDNAQVTLGAGQDRVIIGGGQLYDAAHPTALEITDFTAGNSGDILELDDSMFPQGWDRVSNPFTDGYLKLSQVGADTVILEDYDGPGPGESYYELALLRNVDASTLTAYNFGGYAPDGSASSFTLLQGTSGDDHLYGTNGADVINGGDGNDVIDELKGGSDTINAGAGNDLILVDHYSPNAIETITVNAGTGQDDVEINTITSNAIVDLGDGDDHIYLHGTWGHTETITLGAGSDTVEFDDSFYADPNSSPVITDFQTGDGGDRLDWADYAQWMGQDGESSYNPFLQGEARLVQVGSDVQLQITGPTHGISIPSFSTLLVFDNTNVADFTAWNLGYDPYHPTQIGSAGDDVLTGTSGDDVIYGGDGNDQLSGNDGSDVLWGEGGDDTLTGGVGNDLLRGGAGNDNLHGGDGADDLDGGIGVDIVDGGEGDDVIVDKIGSDTITGGAGNDRIDVSMYWNRANGAGWGSLNAGDGNDYVTIENTYQQNGYAVDLGAGDDTIKFDDLFGPLTLGTGRDTIEWLGTGDGVLQVNDFQPGDSGDVFDLRTFWGGHFGTDINQDLFATGIIQLRQVGTEVRLYLYAGAVTPTLLARFYNTDLSQFTAANFSNVGDPHAVPSRIVVVSTDTTIAAGVVRKYTDHVAVNGSEGYSYSGAYYITNHATLTNHGTINNLVDQAGGPNAAGIMSDGYSVFDNASDGHVVVENQWIDISGQLQWGETVGVESGITFVNDGMFEVEAASGEVHGVEGQQSLTNTGTLTVSSGYDAYGVFGGSTDIHFNNSGSLTVSSGYDAYGVYGGSTDIHFSNSGTIQVHGGDFAIGVYLPDFGMYADGTHDTGFNNAGTITATTNPGSPYYSVGVYLSETLSSPNGAYEHYNSGTISADIAFEVENDHSTYDLVADHLHNSGTMIGSVILSYGDDVVDNTGEIDGRVLLGPGDDTYDGSSGHESGSVEGGTGNDVISAGSDDDNLYGDEGADTISGGDGNDFIEGGEGADHLYGDGGFDIVGYDESLSAVTIDLNAGIGSDGVSIDVFRGFEGILGSRFNDSLLGSSGADTLLGGAGDDHINGRTGDDVIRGGVGSDDLTGGGGNDRFLFSAGDGSDVIRDFSAGDQLAVYGSTLPPTVLQVGSDVRVSISPTDQITLLHTTVDVVMAGLTVSKYPLGVAPSAVDQTVHIMNENYVIPIGATITLSDPAPFTERFVTQDGLGVILDSTSYSAGSNFYNAGSFNFTNCGSTTTGITATDEGYFDDDQTFVNEGTGSIYVEGTQGNVVGITVIPEIFNLGTLTVISETGDATGASGLWQTFSSGAKYDVGYIVNAGVMDVEAAGRAVGIGLGGGSASQQQIFNSGSLLVHGGVTSTGIEWSSYGARYEIINSGKIDVSDGTSAKDSAAILVTWIGNTSIWNSGTLKGDYAIAPGHYSSGEQGTLTIYNSGQMLGDVDLLGTAGGNVTLINSGGVIAGAVSLTNHDDVFDGRSGSLSGTLSGNGGNDELLAGAGSQTILGGTGDDILSGGAGNDLLTGGAGADHFRFGAGFGTDTINDFDAASDHVDVEGYTAWQAIAQQGADVVVTFAPGDELILQNETLSNVTSGLFTFSAAPIAATVMVSAPTAPSPPDMPHNDGSAALNPIAGSSAGDVLTGTDGDDALAGGLGNDVLNGGAGNDRLDGGAGDDRLDGGVGADAMAGGSGNDSYVVDNAADVVTENYGQGTDLVTAAISYQLGANVENLTLTGTAALDGFGNSLANEIRGNSGNNLLDGGSGADSLWGGAGNDTYVVDNPGDVITESVNGGIDLAVAGISFSLAANVENLTLVGSLSIDGTGNSSANTLIGNDAANQLFGGADDDLLYGNGGNDTLDGGAGVDRLAGGIGDDSYYVDNYSDRVVENAGEGTDSVFSTANFKLSANVENLTLEGSALIWGYGNALDNGLTGNDVANKLYGLDGNDVINGKGGIDLMFGGVGDDTYIVDAYGDRAIEKAGEGTDSVFASADYKLGVNVENLTLTGTSDIWGYGNVEDNLLTGNNGANKLYGLAGSDTLNGGNGNDWLEGGVGQDQLTGGAGADSFVFRHGDFGGATVATADEITDFTHGEDHIRLNYVDANSTVTGDQAFAFMGISAFDGHAGELRYEQISGNTYVEGDTNGDGVADFMIRVDGLHTLTSGDFAL